RTERPCPIDATGGGVRRNDPIRRLPLLHPLLERRDRVERVRPLAAAAVPHAGRHEQTIRADHDALAAEPFEHSRVVLRAARRRDLRIAPAVVLNHAAATIDERLEVW